MDLRSITDLEGGRLQSGKLFGPVGPAIPTNSSLEGHCQSVVLWVHFSLARTSCRHWHIGPFKSASLTPPSPRRPTQQRNADQLVYPQIPAVKTNHGTPACPPSPGVNSPLTPLLHRRHHRLHRLTA